MSKEEMLNKIIKQLRRFYGGFADNYTSSEIRLTNNISEIIGKGFGTRMDNVSSDSIDGIIYPTKLFNQALSKEDIKTMTKEEFRELARKHLTILESPAMDANGNFPMKIYGLDNLYDKIFSNDNVCNCGSPKPEAFESKKIVQIQISRSLLKSLRKDIIDLIQQNVRCENSIERDNRYLRLLESEIKQIDKLLKQ